MRLDSFGNQQKSHCMMLYNMFLLPFKSPRIEEIPDFFRSFYFCCFGGVKTAMSWAPGEAGARGHC